MMFSHLVTISLFFYGLASGSFLNVVVYRLNHGKNPLAGRSFCPRCLHQLAWFDNLPLLSFFLLRGKCRYCHSPISWQYPLVELATAILSVAIYQWSIRAFGPNLLATGYWLLMTYALIAIFVSDLMYQTIPDQISYPAMAASLVWHLSTNQFSFILAGLTAAAFFLFLHLLTRGKGMAMGDVKLAFLLGLVLGWSGLVVCLYLAFLTGALTGIILILLKRRKFGQVIPFGPFLVGGAVIALFWGQPIINLYLSLTGF